MKNLWLTTACAVALAACAKPSGDTKLAAEAAPEAEASKAHESGHWDYAHQDDWDEMGADAKVCDTGSRQSPIELTTTSLIDEPDIVVNYASASSLFHNNGHTLQLDIPAGQFATIGGMRYDLLQAHFHDPSEHHLDGKTYAMELHFVHKNAAGGLAVLGVLMNEGAANAALAPLWAAMPTAIGKEKSTMVDFDPNALLPADRVHFKYEGSLTTPPCSEGVAWHVLRTPIDVSAEQVAAFKAVVGENARAMQKVNDRPVSEGE